MKSICRSEGRGKEQESRGKSQEARGKSQEARGKRPRSGYSKAKDFCQIQRDNNLGFITKNSMEPRLTVQLQESI